jgi:hypothetical protein
MKKSHKHVLDRLRQGWWLDTMPGYTRFCHLCSPHSPMGAARRVEQVREATISEMRAIGLLKMAVVHMRNTLVPFDYKQTEEKVK